MSWYLNVLRNYVQFHGRARRKEYWLFGLFSAIISILLSVIGTLIHFKYLNSLYSLAVFLPTLAVTIRRLHDIGRKGWWVLIGLIPLIGWIILIVFYCLDSQPGTNKYGPNPKE
jgi:uncharacterized membrane protein YhaH (DUF805 family)